MPLHARMTTGPVKGLGTDAARLVDEHRSGQVTQSGKVHDLGRQADPHEAHRMTIGSQHAEISRGIDDHQFVGGDGALMHQRRHSDGQTVGNPPCRWYRSRIARSMR